MSLILSGHIGRCRAGMTVCHAAPKPALRNYSLIHYGVFYPLFCLLSTPKRAVFLHHFRGAQTIEILVQRHQCPEALNDILCQFRREHTLVRRGVML